jgi:hypothetical protein
MKLSSWKEAIAKKMIIQGRKDHTRALQMEEMAFLREEYLHQRFETKFLALKLEAYYDIIKELLYAHMYKQGFVCSHDQFLLIYAHHHFHDFKEQNKVLKELFSMKLKIHSLKPKKLKRYFAKNEDALHEIIYVLKERLRIM